MLDRCSACPTESDGRYCSRPIPPTSTGRATYLFLGAGPGKADAKTLTPYSGLGGIELNETYLPIAGLWRESEHLVLANASMCWDHTDRTPHENRVLSCARAHLPQLLSTVQPTVLVLMGGVTQKIADYPIRLNLHHGIPLWTTVLNGEWEGWVWPSYEPALGIRETGKMTQLMEDFRNLGKWMKGEWLPAYLTADAPERDYGLLATVREFDEYLERNLDVRASGGVLRAGVDTERHGAAMWSIQFSVRKHTGRMFRTDHSPESNRLIKRFRQWTDQACDEILLHNREQDENALHSIGADVPEDRVRDTMKECYHLCKVPQGLKEAIYRLVGYSMPGWEDTVRAASTDAVLNWIARAKELAQTQPEAVIHELKRGRCADCGHQHSKGPCKREGCECTSTRVTYSRVEWKPSALESVLTHVERYTLNTRDAEDPYDPWGKIGEKGEMRKGGLRGKIANDEQWEWVERELGPTPILGIGNCELKKAIVYGCLSGDSRVLLATGEYARIVDLVKRRYTGGVWSVSPTGAMERKRVTGWHRLNYSEAVIWYGITTEFSRRGRWNASTRYTPDHRLLTTNGWLPISEIKVGQKLVYPVRSLDSVQLQVVLGSILGDGSISQKNKGGWASLRFTHCERQLPYLRWKTRLLLPLDCRVAPIKPAIKTICGQRVEAFQHWECSTPQHPELKTLRESSYRNGNKKIGDWIESIGPLAIAIWYQDDGCLVKGESARFYTNSFSSKDLLLLQKRLSVYNIESTQVSDSRCPNQHFLCIPKQSSRRLFRIVAEFVHPCMNYKLPIRYRGRFNDSPQRVDQGLVQAEVTWVGESPFPQERRGSIKTAYCLDVEDNHCFVTMEEVAHNCGDADMTLQLGEVLAGMREGEEWKVSEEDWDQ